jgi:hypothetical protein
MTRGRGATTFDTVRAIGAALPGVEEGTAWGAPALKLHGTLLACMASHRSAEPGTLVLRLDVEQRDALIADAPAIYYLTPHYVDSACVLVRLARVDRAALADLLRASWRFVGATAPRRARRRPPR